MFIPLLFATSILAAPQTPQFQESVVVHLVDIDVVATDRRGEPIHGLTAADFELVENGVVKPITHFEEVRATRRVAAQATAAEQPTKQAPRALAIFIDNASISEKVRKELLIALQKKVGDLTADGVGVMVAVWSNKLDIVCPLTTDGAVVARAIDILAGNQQFANDQHARYQRRMAAADAGALGAQKVLYGADWLQMERHRFASVIAAMDALVSLMPDSRTKRSILYVGDGFIARAEELADLPIYGYGDPPPLPATLMETTYNTPPPIATPTEGRWFAGMNATDRLARLANLHGITIHAAYGGGLAAAAREPSAMRNPIRKDLPAMATSSLDSLNIIARTTGGTSTGMTNLMLPVLERVQSDLGSYYTLAYRTESRGAEARKIEVRLKNQRGARLRYQREVVLTRGSRTAQ